MFAFNEIKYKYIFYLNSLRLKYVKIMNTFQPAKILTYPKEWTLS